MGEQTNNTWSLLQKMKSLQWIILDQTQRTSGIVSQVLSMNSTLIYHYWSNLHSVIIIIIIIILSHPQYIFSTIPSASTDLLQAYTMITWLQILPAVNNPLCYSAHSRDLYASTPLSLPTPAPRVSISTLSHPLISRAVQRLNHRGHTPSNYDPL